MKWLNILIYIFISLPTFAFSEVACSHEEICKLVTQIDSNVKTKTLISIKGDPHEFEPSSEEIKSFLSAPILITGPDELNPWIKKINYQRSKNQALKTYRLKLSPQIITFYQSNNKEALSHFWLYPRTSCDFKNQILAFDIFSQIKSKSKCDVITIENELESKLKKINNPIVLTHDALYPLLRKYIREDVLIINLKGSNHHEEISPQAIKNIYKIKEKRITWILEKNIAIPDAINKIIKNEDKKIFIDTANNVVAKEFSTLNLLLSEIN